MSDKPCAATPSGDIRDDMMNCNVPKSEREHWAVRRIKELEEALKPFAVFACSERNECKCNNCVARDLLEK